MPPYFWLSSAWPDGLRLSVGTLLGLAWLMGAERLWTHRVEWAPREAELQRDAAFLGLSAVVDALGGLALSLLMLVLPSSGWLHKWPFLPALMLAISLGELGPWALHRWAHRGGWAWRVHALHHRPDKLNTANAVLVHPLNLLWNQAARALPWMVLGFAPEVLVAAALFLQVQSLAVHANLRGDLGPLSGWIGHAGLHRWHHSRLESEALNFGTALPLWDRLFGSYRAAPDEPELLGVMGLVPPRLSQWPGLLLGPWCQSCAE